MFMILAPQALLASPAPGAGALTPIPLPSCWLQFGNKLILEYLTHQRRLMPGLATAFAMHLGMVQIKVGPGACLVTKKMRRAGHMLASTYSKSEGDVGQVLGTRQGCLASAPSRGTA
jgi:hypothetical protein